MEQFFPICPRFVVTTSYIRKICKFFRDRMKYDFTQATRVNKKFCSIHALICFVLAYLQKLTCLWLLFPCLESCLKTGEKSNMAANTAANLHNLCKKRYFSGIISHVLSNGGNDFSFIPKV